MVGPLEIKFKSLDLRAQWAKLLIVNTKLVYITLYAAELMGNEATITHILRTPAQQAIFYPDNPKKQTVHFYYRGVDLRTRDYNDATMAEMEKEINYKFPYGKYGVDTAVYHDIGLGKHLHLQTKEGGI